MTTIQIDLPEASAKAACGIEKLEAAGKRRISDTLIELGKFKQRINAQETT